MYTKMCFLLILLTISLLSSAVPERPDHCLKVHPIGNGACEHLIFGFYYNPATDRCEKWSDVGCTAEGGHSFRTEEQCARECIEI